MTPNPQTKLNETNDKMYGLLSENLSGIPMTVQTRPESTKLPVKHRWFFPLSVSHPKTIYTSLFFVGIVVDLGEGGGEHN